MNDYCFISCYFISFKINSNRYNLNVKYRIGYRYRQISVIKNRNIGISVFSHIGASLVCNHGNCAELGSLSYPFIIEMHCKLLMGF